MASLLIVEDERVLRRHLARLLAHAGYAVETAASRAEAEARLEQRRFDALLLDVSLPDGDGLDLLRALPDAQRPPRTVVMTAAPGSQCERHARHLRVTQLLYKPFELDEVLAALSNAAPIEQ